MFIHQRYMMCQIKRSDRGVQEKGKEFFFDERRRYYRGIHWLQDQQNEKKSMIMYQDMLIKKMLKILVTSWEICENTSHQRAPVMR